MECRLSEDARSQVFLCPSLAAQVLRLWTAGGTVHELRHLLVVIQRRFPAIKPLLAPAWDTVGRWDDVLEVAQMGCDISVGL